MSSRNKIRDSFTAAPSGKHVQEKDLPGVYPQPIIIEPLLEHQQTFIILHGRGSTAEKFSTPLLETATPSGEKLQMAFPHARLVFPTASRNRATIYKKSYTHQWFDNWHLDDKNSRQDLMRDGLHKSITYIHHLLEQEIELIGRDNVVLWGLSQGCATSLMATLTWDHEPFAATIGMCGFLPFANHIQDIAKDDDLDSESDPFCASDDEDEGPFCHDRSHDQDRATQAIQFLRDEIELEGSTKIVFQEIPIFLGHGTEDERVPIELGREARSCLDLVKANVRMIEYEGLGHWYSHEMLDGIFEFLKETLCTEMSEF